MYIYRVLNSVFSFPFLIRNLLEALLEKKSPLRTRGMNGSPSHYLK